MDDIVLEKFLVHLESRWSTPKYPNIASVQQTCDESIKDIQEVLRRVADVCNAAISRCNAYRNAASSIHCLPVEIIQVIFEFAGQRGLDRRTNLTLTSVCTYWRSVALNDPCMWSCLDEATTPLNYAQLCTHRNRCMPLHITRVWPEWAKGYSSPRWLLDFTARNLARLKTLHFKVGTDDDTEPPVVTRYPAPMLEELVLHVDHQSEIYTSVLGDLAPRLRTLELYNCRWPWRPSTYQNLTKLKVTLPYAVDSSPLGEDITVICRESPGLEELCLCIGGEKVSGPPSTLVVPQYGDERTVMRSLRRLTLALRIDLAVSLLSSIHLTSTTTHIDIVALIENDAPDTLDSLFSAQCIPSWLYAGLDQLSLKTLDRRCEIRGAGFCEGVPYDLSVAWKGRSLIGRTWGPVVAAIVRDHALPAVSQLALTEDSNTRHNHEDLPLVGQQPLLLRLPTVSSLSINYWSPRGAAGFFKKLHSFLSTQSSRPLPAVSQFALAIRDCWGQYSYDLLSVLQDFGRLNTIHIKDSRLTIGSIDNARDFVSRVRELDVPDVRWSRSYMYAWGEGNSQRLVYPRDLWPEDAKYDWLCDEEASHAASSVNAFGQTWCCGYGAARR